jgi:putative Mn2+ efflux pump MntP
MQGKARVNQQGRIAEAIGGIGLILIETKILIEHTVIS